VPGPSVLVRFLADTKELKKAADDGGKNMGKFQSTALKTAGAIGGAFAALKVIEFGKDSVAAASDLNESFSKVGVVFGTSAKQVQDWSKNSATAMGISQQAALEAAGTFGNLAVSLKLPQATAATMSTKLVGLAGDLASFNNVDPKEALEALRSGLTGETEPLKKFGVNLNDAALKAKAMQLHLSNGKGVLTASAKAQAAYALILEQTKTAQGDFARTSGGLANQQRIAQAQFENLKATVGTAFLPVIVKLAGVFTKDVVPILKVLSTVLKDNAGWLLPLAGVIAGIVAAVKIWTAVQAALDVVMAANPIVLIVAAVAALAAGIYFLATRTRFFQTAWEAVWGALKAAWNWIRANWPLLLGILLGPIGLAAVLIARHWKSIWDGLKAVWNWIKANWPLLLAVITGPIGLAVLAIAKNWHTIMDGVTAVKDWIVARFNDVVSFFTRLPGRIASMATHMFDGIANAFIEAINAIIRVWNALQFKIPGFHAGPVHFGGFTLGVPDIPTIPHLAAGGLITESGMVFAHAGEVISPAPAGAGGPAMLINTAHFSSEVDVDLLMRKAAWVVQTSRV
jgi:hypothetical protein